MSSAQIPSCDSFPRATTTEDGVELVGEAWLPTEHGDFRIHGFRFGADGEEIVALTYGEIDSGQSTLVRIHSQCLTGDVFGSVRCDCGRQLDAAMALIVESGSGVIVYQQAEGRGIGIANKIRAYELQDGGLDTVEANIALGFAPDERSYERCASVLERLGVRRVRLLSNNPEKVLALREAGMESVVCAPLSIAHDERFAGYLKTKREKMGHTCDREG